MKFSASVSRRKGVIYIDSGIEKDNIEPAKAEIMKQVELAAKGEFTDELLDKTKLLLSCALKSVFDSPKAAADWVSDGYLDGDIFSPEEAAERINAVTREQICRYGASLTLDTVYVLTGKEN